MGMAGIGWGAETTVAPKVPVKLRLSAPEKMKAELTRQLRESFESVDGVVITDTAFEYEVDVMAVDEPLGRVALSCTISLPFNRSENAISFRTLLEKHWKGGLKDDAWVAFAEYFAPYRAPLLKQIQSVRKSKLPELCDGLAADFAQKVLKRDVPTATASVTPGTSTK
jgi:hypothetical protein